MNSKQSLKEEYKVYYATIKKQRHHNYEFALKKYDDLNQQFHKFKEKTDELGKVPTEQFWNDKNHLKVIVQFFEYKLQIRRKYEELRRLLEDCQTYSFLLKKNLVYVSRSWKKP